MRIDDGREGASRGEWARRVGIGVLDGDRDELPVRMPMLFVEVLPPGQLVTAASPGAPHVKQSVLATKVAEGELTARDER